MKDDEFIKAGPGTLNPAVKKLTDWKKEPSVAELKKDFSMSKMSHDSMMFEVERWRNLRNPPNAARAPRSDRDKKDANRSKVQPKLVRRQAEWRYSALTEPFLNNQKLFQAEPRTFEDQLSAQQNELVLNHQIDTKLNRVKLVDEYVRSAVDEGTVYAQVGWRRETREVSKTVPVFEYFEASTPEELKQLEQAMALKQQNPNGYLDLDPALQAAVDYSVEMSIPAMARQIGEQSIKEEEILHNHPTVRLLKADNCYPDPTCEGDPDRMQFFILTFETSKAECLKDGRYTNLDAVNWSGLGIVSDGDHTSSVNNGTNFEDTLRRKVIAYEYWGFYEKDGDERLHPIVSTWIGDVMVRCEDSPFPDGKLPFVIVPYMPRLGEVSGEPDAELLEDNQMILGALSRGMIDLMGRSANSQTGIAKGFLDVMNRKKFEQGRDYEFNPGTDPRLAVYQHSFPEIPASALNMYAMQNQEAEALTGVKAFSGGLSGQAYGDVAAGIKGLLDAAAKREMSILRRLVKGMQDIGTKIASMNAIFLSEEETIRITNTTYAKVRREDLKGNFDLKIDIATIEVDEAKAQNLGFMLQTLGPTVPVDITMTLLAEIARLRRMPVLENTLKNYKPEPDPHAEALKSLELRKLEAEVAEMEANSRLKVAQAEKAMAEARMTSSSADKLDLDFVEQETGTKHARDMQKQSEQARGNMDLEVVKSLLSPTKSDDISGDIEGAIGYSKVADRVGMTNTLGR